MSLHWPWLNELPDLKAKLISKEGADWKSPFFLLWNWNHKALESDETGETYKELFDWICANGGGLQALTFDTSYRKKINPTGREAIVEHILRIHEYEMDKLAAANEARQEAEAAPKPEPLPQPKSRWEHMKDTLKRK